MIVLTNRCRIRSKDFILSVTIEPPPGEHGKSEEDDSNERAARAVQTKEDN